MKILAFSDLHRDLDSAERLVEQSADADLVIGAGDFANMHEGLEEILAPLRRITTSTLLVPGNNETEEALREAASEWESAEVLHGEATDIAGITFFGLGGGIPLTPWEWSYDLADEEAAELMEACPAGAVLVLHSPPKDACDTSSDGTSLGSPALRTAIEEKQPALAVCGHIHEAWGARETIGATPVANLGPRGAFFDL